MNNLQKFIVCMGMAAFSLPASAQGGAAEEGARLLLGKGVKGLSTFSIMKSANVSGGMWPSAAHRFTQPFNVQRAAFSAIPLTKANAAFSPVKTSVAMPKMMATPSQYRFDPMERIIVHGHNTRGTSGLGRMTMYREYTGPGLTISKEKPAVPKTVSSEPTDGVFLSSFSEEDFSYFHRWGKEGREQDVQAFFRGDPYAEGQREIKRLEQIVRNGVGTSSGQRPSGFALQLQREADAPLKLLSPKELREFNTTVAVGREAAATAQPRVSKEVNPFRKKAALNGPDSPSVVELSLPGQKSPSKVDMYEGFDVRNYLVYEPYSLPFNSNVQSLEVLAASDDIDFLDYLNKYAEKPNSQVHLTQVSSGNGAIAELKAHPEKYHVVLTDVHMLNGTGKDIARYVLQAELPCYTVTMSKDLGDPSQLFLEGFDGSLGIFLSPGASEIATMGMYGSVETLYRPAKEVFAYLSNLVAREGHAF